MNFLAETGRWSRVIGLAKASTILIGLLVVGCGGGGGSSSSTTYQPSVANGNFVVLNLETGSSTVSVADPGIGTPQTIVLKRVSPTTFLGVTEVTRGQWQAIAGTSPWTDVPTSVLAEASLGDPLRPACNISQVEATGFCSSLGTKVNLAITLPSLATFRALIGTNPFPWGTADDEQTVSQYASVLDTSSQVGILREVGTGSPVNGLYDVIGNVREWTTDGPAFGGSSLDDINVIKSSPTTNAIGPNVEHPLYGLRVSLAVP